MPTPWLLALALLSKSDDPAPITLTSLDGARTVLKTADDGPPIVLAWTAVGCPMARVYTPRILALAKEFEARGVRVWLIDSNAQDSEEELLALSEEFSLTRPLVRDVGGVLAERFEVTRTTEVLVLDTTLTVRYRGAVDDQYGYRTVDGGGVGTYRKDAPTQRYLADALEAVLEGDAPATERTDPMGCALGDAWASVTTASDGTAPTFHRDITPLLQRHCQSCHHDGGNAPFPLVQYDDVRGWAPMIAEVVTTRRMPPWNAAPDVGHFRNDRRLADEDVATFARWTDADAPEGDVDDAPAALTWSSDWAIGTPDVVYTAEPQEIPAEGRLPYRYVRVKTRFDEDRWVKAAQIRSSAPQVVHHVLIFESTFPPPRPGADRPWMPPIDQGRLMRQMTNAERRRLLPRLAGYAGDFAQGKGGGLLGYFLSGLPGDAPTVYPEGHAKLLPRGATLIFQIHYAPNGVEAISGTELALTFADGPPDVAVDARAASTLAIEIPPGATNHAVEASYRFPRGAHLLSMAPHMHLRGKAAEYTLETPDGLREPLLHVPDYDFDWQLHYHLAEPRYIPAGSTLHARVLYDNSVNNPYNPDPDQTVYFGLQTEEEMMICYFEVAWDQQ